MGAILRTGLILIHPNCPIGLLDDALNEPLYPTETYKFPLWCFHRSATQIDHEPLGIELTIIIVLQFQSNIDNNSSYSSSAIPNQFSGWGNCRP